MTSFISNSKKFVTTYFKSIKFIFITLLLVVLIEAGIAYSLKDKEMMKNIFRENILLLNFLKQDNFANYFIGNKNYAFFNKKVDFVQIGDSSGMYGIKPLIVQEYLKNLSYINTNSSGVASWDGYFCLGKNYLENHPEAKFLVLHVSPYALPSATNITFGKGLGPELFNLYCSNWHKIHELPSIYHRKATIKSVYHKPINYPEIAPPSLDIYIKTTLKRNQSYVEYISSDLGWFPLERNKNFDTMPLGECGPQIMEYFFDKKTGKSILTETLTRFKQLADHHKVKLVILFNPVACTLSDEIAPIVYEIEKFKKQNPDVAVPLDVFHTYDKDYFADKWHLLPEGADKHSHEVGEKLAEFLAQEQKSLKH